MIVAYIAGRFRGANAWEVERNIRKAEELAFAVAEIGVMPLCPHTNTRFFDGTLTPEWWLDGTLELMKRCDCVVLVDNWQQSSGARNEVAVARECALPVFHSLGEFKEWLAYRAELEKSA